MCASNYNGIRLKYLVIILTIVALPVVAEALSLNVPPSDPQCKLVGGDGNVRIYNYQIDTLRNVTYEVVKGKVSSHGMNDAARVLRSPDGNVGIMDGRIVMLLDQVQDHFRVPIIEVISGYRSPAYNGTLKREGRDVSRNSLHMQGQAVDLHVSEVSEETVRDYIKSLRCGGVGIYPNLHFVHADFGPRRMWGDKRVPGNRYMAVGVAPIVATTNKEYYREGEVVQLASQTANQPVLQHWRSATWHTVKQPLTQSAMLTLASKQLRHGKYRFRVGHGFSNEFYFKKM